MFNQNSNRRFLTNLVTDLQVLLELREVDIESMKVGVGDGIRLRAGVAKLRALHDLPPPLIDDKGNIVMKPVPVVEKHKTVGADGERVYSLAEVEKLLAGKAAITAGGAEAVRIAKLQL